jgi:hypothetical protein
MIPPIVLEVKPLGLVATAGCKTPELEPPSPHPRYHYRAMLSVPWPGHGSTLHHLP